MKTDYPLFDEFGRRIPSPTLKAPCHRKTRRWFIPVQPEVDFGAIHARITGFLGGEDPLTAQAFEARARTLRESLQGNPLVRSILNGVQVPFLLPKASHADIGTALEDVYLPALGRAFGQKLPEYQFTNHHTSGLNGRLSPTLGSRHEKLIEAMSKGPVVGWYFPCLLEYSLPAALEQMVEMPEAFMLAGGYDTSAAFIGSPDLLLRRDGYPPLLWLAGLTGERADIGYHLEAYGYNLTFNRRAHFGQAAEYWASGLVVVD